MSGVIADNFLLRKSGLHQWPPVYATLPVILRAYGAVITTDSFPYLSFSGSRYSMRRLVASVANDVFRKSKNRAAWVKTISPALLRPRRQSADFCSKPAYPGSSIGTSGSHDERLALLVATSSSSGANDSVTPRYRAAVSAHRKKRPSKVRGPCSTVISSTNGFGMFCPFTNCP